jgi:mono/diheme cytochrome c family protein
MRTWKKAGVSVVGAAILLAGGLGAGAQIRHDRKFDVPEPALRAVDDPEVIARGRYLAYGPAHCAYCHTPMEMWPELDAGGQPPLRGGGEFVLPLGVFRAPNLTPDPETGIGALSDGQLARMLRHNVLPDGRAALPLMEFQNLSDEDVVALLSFLRSQEPVRNQVGGRELTMMGKAIMAYVIKPSGPEGTPLRAAPPEGPTVERGEYLANSVSLCVGCHTQRSLTDGSYTGPRFAGGFHMDVDGGGDQVFVTPNLTPDPQYGVMSGWSEEAFIARFRAGPLLPGTHMPWNAYGRMSDDDLRAIFRYLRTLEAVPLDPGPVLQPRKPA